MLQAKTKEQRDYIENILDKYMKFAYHEYCKYSGVHVYRNCNELVELELQCEDCENMQSINVSFDAMAEIVDYLRAQNKEVK